MKPQSAKLASRRPSRNLPPVNYSEDTEDSEAEETFNSVASNISTPTTPLSPSNPYFLLQPSPPPTSQVLNDVASNLTPIAAIQAVKPNWPVLGDEEELEDLVAAAPDNLEVAAMPNDAIVNFEDEDGTDDANAMQEACRNLQRLEFEHNDLDFWFNQVEIKMSAVGVKKNFTKFQVLTTIIPKKVIDQVKPLLRKKQTDFPNKDAYKQLKNTIIRIFGPRPEARMERALSRVLTDRPSDLARQLVNDVCLEDLEGCRCCPAIISALWKRHLPGAVRAGIAHCEFTKETFDQVTQLADDIFASNAPAGSVAALNLDETQPAIAYPLPEVSAIRGGSNRGRGRGARNRGRGRGTGAAPTTPAAPTAGNQPRRGTKHPDLPPGEWTGCNLHYRWGKSAHFCSEPATCPWKNIFTPKPPKN